MRASKKRKNPFFILTSVLLLVLVAFAAGSAAILFALLLLVLVLFYPVFLLIWDRLYRAQDIADQLFYAHTTDGWNIAMHFHRPPYPQPGAYPVILSHGIAVNKYGVDMDETHSLAYFLKQNGFAVFVLSLRGVGKSYHASRFGYQDFCFDDIVENDVPAVIAKARELTGAPKINWVGHSMGAMIAMGFMGRELPGHEDIAAFVSLGGPGRIDFAKSSIWGKIRRYPWMNELMDLKFSAQAISPLTGRLNTPIEELVYNRNNISPATIRRLMKNGIENISHGLARQFIDWMNTGEETTRDGSENYRDSLANIRAPALFLAGTRDHIAVPESVRFAYEQASSKRKDYKLLGTEQGCKVDYCHTGLALGDYAVDDVFPLVLDWLNRYGRERGSRNIFARIVRRVRRRRRKRREERNVRGRRSRITRPGVIRA
ncbi:MAG: alpha/beta fold hydrolase [Spirochaetales bacterium]|nr:alpha/beta fold hydrolase [Leptospiraceae bacterium]MCP5483466.1 alpha/beta fold hydrolase [Spirochaetales bacterium]MCP5486547.1 alpha/beta fold hydrolase [Spirochaetales bacterium]